ncbi:MAG: HAMP domain-containing sensor histidine kinase [Bacteroidota bacterium]
MLEQPPRPGAARVPGLRGNGRVPIRFGLADEDGRLVLPMEGADVGTVLPREVLATGQPMLVDEQRVGTVFIPEEPFGDDDPFPEGSPEVAFLRTTSRATIAALGSGMLVALGLVWMLAGRIVRPLQELTAASQAMAAGDLRQSVGAETDDEVGRLAAAFNAMSAKLSEATALRRQMTADVAHDLRTPLAAVIAMLEAMRDGALPATPERLAAAHAEADRLGRLVGDLHTLALADAREVPIHRATVHPPDVLRQLALANEATATRDGLTLTVCETTAPAVFADHDRLVQAVGNLVSNAMRHTPPGGTVQLNARAERGGVAFLVTDTGVGIPPDLLPRVFERSVRGDTARSGEGSGLGLPITRALAEAMGGRAGIASPPGSGTTAWLWLPTATQNDRAALPRS